MKINFAEKQKEIMIAITAIVFISAGALYLMSGQKPSQGDKPVIDSSVQNNAVQYKNSNYGFEFDLPASWRGFSVVADKWQGYAQGENGQVLIAEGPQLSIRHPLWTQQKPRQDIPIMIFTLAEWNDMQEDKFHIGAAPINPSELGRNSRYVFALPARYNYAFPEGYEEVEKILEGKPLHAY